MISNNLKSNKFEINLFHGQAIYAFKNGHTPYIFWKQHEQSPKLSSFTTLSQLSHWNNVTEASQFVGFLV